MFETQGGTRNQTRDLPKKGSAFITSSDHWTNVFDDLQEKGSAAILCSEDWTKGVLMLRLGVNH